MQRNLYKLERWSGKELLEFNPDKSTANQVGHRSLGTSYTMNEKEIKSTESEKDLDVLIKIHLNPAQNIRAVVTKVSGISGLVKRNFTYMNVDVSHTILLFSLSTSVIC